MIYHLFQLLEDYDIPGQGLMTYLSFRAMLASVTAMLLSLFSRKNRSGRRFVTSDWRDRCRRKARLRWVV